jgi:hypothetical protein
MQPFHLLFKISPSGFFGLPDGSRVVLPVRENREIVGPVLDTRTGHLVAHGTMSEFRPSDGCASASISVNGIKSSLRDNFLKLDLEALSAQDAVQAGVSYAKSVMQALSVMHRERFSAEFMSIEDSLGNVQRPGAPLNSNLLNITNYHIGELNQRFVEVVQWAGIIDARAKKALFYFEHACLLNEFSQSLPFSGPHAAFSRSLAFLQVFKALTSIIGDPSSDKDYQSRCKRLGLGKDFWPKKAQPLYLVRSQKDVAHYSESLPEMGAFLELYGQACIVFGEAFSAHMTSIAQNQQ